MDIGPYLIAKGNTLRAVAEFARIRDEGVFLNAINWKEAVLRLFPSASVFLVYVSNRSNGLKYELESLLHKKLEAHSVLVLDPKRSAARQSFYEVQNDLIDDGNNLLFSVIRDACEVDDPEEFERLLNRFPFKIEMHTDERELYNNELYNNIVSLIETARRQPENQPSEIPFEFGVQMNDDKRKKVSDFRQFVSRQIDEDFSKSYISNWPALLLFIELDIFLNLIFGKICEAGVSTARYAALADFSTEYLKLKVPDLFSEVGAIFEQHSNMAMNVALDALSFGEWNDYSNRLITSRELVDRICRETNSLLFQSLNNYSRSAIQIPKRPGDEGDRTDDHVDLLQKVLDSQMKKHH